jgi:hypothetical protein
MSYGRIAGRGMRPYPSKWICLVAIMAQIRDLPLFTESFLDVNAFSPGSGSIYFYGTFEERSEHSDEWRKAAGDVTFVKLEEKGATYIVTAESPASDIRLRDLEAMKEFVKRFDRQVAYIDITGLSHHVWAPLVRASWEVSLDIRCVYVEPGDYRFSQTPAQDQIFDLSERIDGIAPIPGFASFNDPAEADVCFVPLLGFEGTRLAYLIEQVQPPGGRIFPIVGVPGFRLEYPFHAYQGNQGLLQSQGRGGRYDMLVQTVHLAYFICLRKFGENILSST